jgi:hypothetical protein
MGESHDFLSTQEALAYIRLHFAESEGIIARIEQGLPIDNAQIRRLEAALQQLHLAWLNEDLVSKQEVRLLWNVYPRLEKSLALYPEREREITEFMSKVIRWMEQLFMTPQVSEEYAIAVISQHVIGPSFLANALLGREITASAVDETFMAVEALARIWKKKENISKLAAGALISTQYLPISEHFSQKKKQDIQKLIQQLSEQITKCWE